MFVYNLFIVQFVTSEGKQEKESDVVWKSLSCTREYCVIHNKPSMHNGQYFTTHKYADDTFFFYRPREQSCAQGTVLLISKQKRSKYYI